jgi:hypothetical protein
MSTVDERRAAVQLNDLTKSFGSVRAGRVYQRDTLRVSVRRIAKFASRRQAHAGRRRQG